MIKNIIFDLGNVLLNYAPEEYIKSKSIEEAKIPEIHEEIFLSNEWRMLDRGAISEEEAKIVLINRSRNNGHLIKHVFENWYDLFTPIQDSVDVLIELKNAGFKLYYLSNFHLLAFENVTGKYDFFKLFDGGVASYEANHVKPEEEIYVELIRRYKIDPKESVFIDDLQRNTEAAKELGFNTILLTNPKDLRKMLRGFELNI